MLGSLCVAIVPGRLALSAAAVPGRLALGVMDDRGGNTGRLCEVSGRLPCALLGGLPCALPGGGSSGAEPASNDARMLPREGGGLLARARLASVGVRMCRWADKVDS